MLLMIIPTFFQLIDVTTFGHLLCVSRSPSVLFLTFFHPSFVFIFFNLLIPLFSFLFLSLYIHVVFLFAIYCHYMMYHT